MVYKYECPNCLTVREYSHKSHHDRALNAGSLCRECYLKQSKQSKASSGPADRELLRADAALGNGSVNCSKCGVEKPLKEYTVNRRGAENEYRLSYCKSCRNQQQYDVLNSSPKSLFKQKFYSFKRRANGKVEISFDYYYATWEKQAGLCFYFGVPMQWERRAGGVKTPRSATLDKIVPELGYVEGNVVFCTSRANAIKNDLSLSEIKALIPDWYSKIVNYIGEENANSYLDDRFGRKWENDLGEFRSWV